MYAKDLIGLRVDALTTRSDLDASLVSHGLPSHTPNLELAGESLYCGDDRVSKLPHNGTIL